MVPEHLLIVKFLTEKEKSKKKILIPIPYSSLTYILHLLTGFLDLPSRLNRGTFILLHPVSQTEILCD